MKSAMSVCPKELIDNHTDKLLKPVWSKPETCKNITIYPIATEDLSSNLNPHISSHWTCFVIVYNHTANAHFQQTRIDVNYKLDNHANENAKRGYIEIRKGERSFWKALDDSNDPKNIEKVQKSIGDDKPTDFTLRDTKIEFERD